MVGNQRLITKRAFLSAVGTTIGAGCLATSNGDNAPEEEPPVKSTNTSRSAPDQEFDPEPKSDEPESDEPSLFLDEDSREILWDNGSQ